MRGCGLCCVVLLLGFSVACSGDDSDASRGSASASGAEPAALALFAPDGDWEVEDPEDHGMDPAALERARDYAFAEGRNTQGVVVVHEDAIVAEWYAEGADQRSWVASWSMAKSFTSALIGIAVSEGDIPSVDEPMTTYYPHWAGTPLHEGTWGDQQVVPQAWVAESLAPSDSLEGYGYQWWLTGNTDDGLPSDTFSARGHDGQFIYVIPSLDLVVVRNGTYIK
jgi:CubicO group peptidase (beta-lactamase class C family)